MNALVIGFVFGLLFGCFGGSILVGSSPPPEPQVIKETVVVEKEVEVEVTRIVTPSSQP